MNKIIAISLCFIFFIYSCNINILDIDASTKGVFGHMDRIEKSNPNLIKEYKASICSLEYATKILSINGEQLNECLKQLDYTLIYIWGPLCKSQVCISPELFEQTANSLGVEYYIVLEYYEIKSITENYNISRPIFGVNCKYYRTNFVKSYITKFFNDVSNGESKYKYDNGRFLIYKEDSLIKQVTNINDVDRIIEIQKQK